MTCIVSGSSLLALLLVPALCLADYYDDDRTYSNTVIKNAPDSFVSVHERKLAFENSKSYDSFGKSVAISGNKVLVGAYGDSTLQSKGGAAYLFAIGGEEPGWTNIFRFINNDTSQFDYYGWSVDLADEWAIIGGWQDDDTGFNSGSVVFWKRTSDYFTTGVEAWSVHSKFSGWEAGDSFGIDVAISNFGLAVVGAPGGMNKQGNFGAGYVSVYQLGDDNIWVEKFTLEASDGAAGDYFGMSVAIDKSPSARYQNRIVVGSYGRDVNGMNRVGVAYIFAVAAEFSTELAQLRAADGGSIAEEFGRSVGIYGDVVVIGADGDDFAGESAGSVYIFQAQNDRIWNQLQEVFPGSSCAYCYFGAQVAIYNNTIIVGTHSGDKVFGSAWVFQRDSETSLFKKIIQLNATDAIEGDQYGCSVALDGTTLVVGAQTSNGYDFNTGAVYVYTSDAALERDDGFLFFDNTTAGSMFLASVMTLCAALVVAAVAFVLLAGGSIGQATETARKFLKGKSGGIRADLDTSTSSSHGLTRGV